MNIIWLAVAEFGKTHSIEETDVLARRLLGLDKASVFEADGGKGSGNFNHKGRPGKRGGSGSGGSKGIPEDKESDISSDQRSALEKASGIFLSRNPLSGDVRKAETKAIADSKAEQLYGSYFEAKAMNDGWFDKLHSGKFDRISDDEIKFVNSMLDKSEGKDEYEKELGLMWANEDEDLKKAYLSIMSKELDGGFEQGIIDNGLRRIGMKVAVMANSANVKSAEEYIDKIGKIVDAHQEGKDFSNDEVRLAGALTISEYERRLAEFKDSDKYRSAVAEVERCANENKDAIEALKAEKAKLEALTEGTSEYAEQKKVYGQANKKAWQVDSDLRKARKRMYEIEKQRNAVSLASALESVRGIGTDVNKFRNYIGTIGRMGSAREVFANAVNYLPKDWIESSVKQGTLDIAPLGNDNRAGHVGTAKASTITISAWLRGENADDIGTAIHEFTHRLELTEPMLHRLEEEFYNKRTKGEEAVPLRSVSKGKKYDHNEMTKVDKFPDPYCGKVYDDGAYEIMTVGFQWAYTNPQKFGNDREYKELVFGALALI